MSENKYQNLLNEWKNYENSSKKISDSDKEKLDDCFNEYIEKINNNTFTLEDYAGPVKESTCTYFCTFIERKSMNPYGYARVGNMYQYGISYVAERKEYYINDSLVDEKSRTTKYSPEKNGKKLQPISVYNKNIAESIFDNKIKSYLKELVETEVTDENINEISKKIEKMKTDDKNEEKISNPIDTKQFFRKIIAMNNKGKFLFIYNDTIDTVYSFFIEENEQFKDLTNLEKNFQIVKKLKDLLFTKQETRHNNDDEYIIELSDFIWKKFNSTLNFESKNTILHGAPGTGKTYMTENSIKNYLEMESGQDINKQFKLQQFHPSFGYEEFIDGIKPTKSKNSNNGIQLELVNGSFKEMCILAFKELIRAAKNNEIPKNYYYVADEINRAELSRVFGELLLCLEEDKRLKVVEKDNKLIVNGTKVQTQNSSLWEKEHAVVILDDKNNIIDLDENNDYLEDGNKYFGVPENLYFIGTMNDIDRSVDSFDMALRRRFIWKHYTFEKTVLENHYSERDGLETFLTKCEDLNEYITSEKGFNLPESYMLGHSYFMHLPSFSNEQLKKLWNNKIDPLLTEYGRVNYEGKELTEKLDCIKKRFLDMKLSDKCK